MKYHIITLDGVYSETAPETISLLEMTGKTKRMRFDLFLVRIELLLRRKRVDRILIDCRPDFQIRWYAGAEAVRAQLVRLRDAGKTVYFHAKQYGMTELYLASACSNPVIHPVGHLQCLGFFRHFSFLKQVLDRHEIEAEIIRAGVYKAAGDIFRVAELDEYNRIQHEQLLDTVIAEYREKICGGYGRQEADFEKLMNGRILSAVQALAEGWVREMTTPEDIIDRWKDEKLKAFKLRKIPRRFGRGKKVAVLEFEGGIKDGESSTDPLAGRMIGSSGFVPVIRRVRKDKSVKGVVLRINSGGGSATASEDILRELEKLRQVKPLAVSMGNVAGSGGYWIATCADKVFAQRTTITGSIGVISVLFYLGKFLERHGITGSVLRRGDYSDLGSVYRKVSLDDRGIIESLITDLYGQFIYRVSDGRKMKPDLVRELGSGRLYSGESAGAVGLTDEIGGLTEALEYINQRLGLKKTSVVFFPRLKRSIIQRMAAKSPGDRESFFPAAGKISAWLFSGVSGGLYGEYAAFTAGAESVIPDSFLVRQNGMPLALMEELCPAIE